MLLTLIAIKASGGQLSGAEDMLARQKMELSILEEDKTPSLSQNEILLIELTVLANKQDSGFKTLIYDAWKYLLTQGKVRKLTPELRAQLDIPRVHCPSKTSNRCSELVAIYLPLSNYLLVDCAAVNEETRSWFFHELVHAVQYTYRFPLDMELLNKYSQFESPSGQKIPENKLIDYLSFYYETQANWYTLRLTEDADWMKERQSGITSGTIATSKILLGLVTMTTSFHIFKSLFEGLLPDIDQEPNSNELHLRGINLHEMLVIKKYYAINPGIHFDFGFLEKYTRAIEHAYFGDLDFLYQLNNGDQKIFRDLHNRFYSEFGKKTSAVLEECGSLLATIKQGSPLLNWLTLPDELFNSCRTYQLPSYIHQRQKFIEFLKADREGAFYHAGTKGGGGPGLKVSPFIHPQLLVIPE